ncbi:hypothetical protein JD844_003923 [Phrynosoma platyrhinos]|uniref:Diacylglycerol kinase accessory domain-containing protein n=1 Tax=Phrynosoma platyrhinos TaxID=52577 RepID=A0ABQ7TMR9_PHRPL|nr:hypothetical protein JD844_003923 [Phrynosoma platyrhinos]
MMESNDYFNLKESSRTKNMMWYGVLGTKELLQRTYKNLEQRVQLECRMVKITIRGDEGVPVQVDGEAWIQPPGMIKIQHKNRAQMLTRDRVRGQRGAEKEREGCKWSWIREAAKTHRAIEQELAHAVNASSLALSETLPSKNASGGSPEPFPFLSRSAAVELSASVKALYTETRAFLEGKLQLDSPQQEEGLRHALSAVSQELQKLSDVHWMSPIITSAEEVGARPGRADGTLARPWTVPAFRPTSVSVDT